jgi:hypothetical protein
MAVMSAVMQFNSGASSRHKVMKAACIPAGGFTSQGSAKKDKARISRSVRNASNQDKERRRKIREAKLAAKDLEGEPSYSSGRFNELDPLGQVDTSSSDEYDYPLARLLDHSDSSDDSDNVPLAQLLLQG